MIQLKKYFIQNIIDSDGRFDVRILFKETVNKLGNSQEQIHKKFLSPEFIKYETLRHMHKS